MAQAEILIEVGVAGYGEDTACSADLPASDDHSAVVQGAILKEDRLDEAGIDCSEEALPSVLVGREVRGALDGDEGARLLTSHVHTRQYDGCDIVLFLLLLRRAFAEEAADLTPALGGADGDQDLLDLVLEDNDQDDEADVDELIQQRTHQSHLQDLRDKEPDPEEGDDPHEE